MSYGNDTNWTQILNTTCGTAGSVWSMTEDVINNILYVGQYSGGVTTENCSIIYNSSDGGLTWGVAWNATEELSASSRHVHMVKFNPYNNYTYATIGDGNNRSGIIRWNNVTWDWILNDTNNLTRYDNFIAIEHTKNYRFYGEDIFCSRIWRTSNDIDYEIVYEPTGENCGHVWTSSQDNRGILYFGYYNSDDDQTPSIVATADEGESFYFVHEDEISPDNSAIWKITSFDDNGYAYFTNGSTIGTGITKFNSLDLSSPKLAWNLNENSGTTAYDVSGNGNNGTITGATWNNDGVNVTLTENVDYSLTGGENNIFTLINSAYDYTNILISSYIYQGGSNDNGGYSYINLPYYYPVGDNDDESGDVSSFFENLDSAVEGVFDEVVEDVTGAYDSVPKKSFFLLLLHLLYFL